MLNVAHKKGQQSHSESVLGFRTFRTLSCKHPENTLRVGKSANVSVDSEVQSVKFSVDFEKREVAVGSCHHSDKSSQ